MPVSKKSILSLTFVLLFLTAYPLAAQDFVVPAFKGKVIDSNTGMPIDGASVVIDFKKSGTLTNKEGEFQVFIPNGEYVFKISHVGYKPYRGRVSIAGKDKEMTISMEDITKQLEEVIVSSVSTRKDIQTPSLGVSILSIKGIKRLPTMMGEVDIMRSLQTLPGVSSVGEGANGLNIRGGNVDQNLIFIDNTPIFNPTHMFGLFSVFASDAIRELELYKGGVPARFGGRTASVLDIKMTEPNLEKFKMQGGIGLVSNRVMAEIPVIKEKLSVLVAGRASFNDFLFKWFAPDNIKSTRANFFDLATKVFYRPDKKNTFSFSSYFSRDYYRVDSLFSLENVIAKQTSFDYGHTNFALSWNHYFNTKTSLDVVGVVSDYKSKTSSVDTVNAIDLNNKVSYKNLKASIDYQPNEAHKINVGLSAVRYDISPGRLNEGVVSRIATVLLPDEQSWELAVHADDEFKVNKDFTIQYGLRYAQFLSIGPTAIRKYAEGQPPSDASVIGVENVAKGSVVKSYGGLEPRLTMKYSLSESSSLKFGYNRMQQFLQLLSNNTTPLPTARWTTANEYIKPQISDFLSLGYFKTYNENVWETSLEAYYRESKNILDYVSGSNLQLNPNIETQIIEGKGRAYGIELMLAKKKGELTGWVSYTFARSLQQTIGDFPQLQQINNGNWFPSNYDKPHNLNMVMNIQPSKHHSFSLTFAYNTGRPFSSPSGLYEVAGKKYPVYTSRNNDRISDYHRLDFSWTIYNPSMKDKRWEGSWVFTIYNLYGRQNAYSVFFKPYYQGVRPYELSVFASPFVSLTYNFKFL